MSLMTKGDEDPLMGLLVMHISSSVKCVQIFSSLSKLSCLSYYSLYILGASPSSDICMANGYATQPVDEISFFYGVF